MCQRVNVLIDTQAPFALGPITLHDAGRASILSTCSKEEDVAGQVIRNLIEQRVSVDVIDNWSSDPTRTKVGAFLARRVIGT